MTAARRARGPGSPAVTYVTSPLRPPARSACERLLDARLMRAAPFAEQPPDGLDVLVAAAGQVHAARPCPRWQTRQRRAAPRRPRATTRAPAGCPRCAPSHSKPSSASRRRRSSAYSVRPLAAQPRVLGADRRVVEAGRDRVRRQDVAVVVLQHQAARAVQHAGVRRRQIARRDRRAQIRGRRPRRRPAARRRRRRTRRRCPSRCCRRRRRRRRRRAGARPPRDLRARLLADHRLELAHHQRIRMRAEHRAEQVVRGRRRSRPSRASLR